jgi:Na+/H+ antiporter NhaD/arsenite permease-like protein
VASFAGFLFALPAIADIPRMRALAWREARTEYAEYYFLFPLFVSISLLTAAGFFDSIAMAVQHGIAALGPSHVALAQFLGSTTLSAILDNNIVADFASRGLPRLELTVLHLFAMAQIAGYALGGCWTHIGSAQSVVAYAFIRRDIDDRYTPVGWIRDITPAIVRMLAAITAVIYLESLVLRWLP